MFIYGHRGAMAVAPENTLAGVRAGLEAGADGIEIDVRRHGRGLVVIHDLLLHRTTSGRGRYSHLPASQLRRLDAGDGEMIPLLQEVLPLLAGKRLNIELKDVASAKLVAAELRRPIAGGPEILVSSFLPEALRVFRRQCRDVPIAVLAGPPWSRRYLGLARSFAATAVHIHDAICIPEVVDAIHQSGRTCAVYTVDAGERLRRLRAMGVDAVFCNDPAGARSALAR